MGKVLKMSIHARRRSHLLAPAIYLAALQRLNSPMSRRMAIVCMTGAAIFAWIGFITASRTAYGLATFVAQHSDFMSMSYSPELLLSELLIAFALCLAFVAIWSRRSAFVSLVVGVSFYLLVEAVWWSTAVWGPLRKRKKSYAKALIPVGCLL